MFQPLTFMLGDIKEFCKAYWSKQVTVASWNPLLILKSTEISSSSMPIYIYPKLQLTVDQIIYL